MSVQTLLDASKNPHGIPGAGDCDDFSVFALAAAMYFNLPANLILAGNKRQSPTHVYVEIYLDGWHTYDLTAPSLDMTKKYTFTNSIQAN
jgi:transglutaminase-like putative cysteine protease